MVYGILPFPRRPTSSKPTATRNRFPMYGLRGKWGPEKNCYKVKHSFDGEKQMSKVIAATYDYKDEKGVLLFQVVRYQPKAFRQRRPIGKIVGHGILMASPVRSTCSPNLSPRQRMFQCMSLRERKMWKRCIRWVWWQLVTPGVPGNLPMR